MVLFFSSEVEKLIFQVKKERWFRQGRRKALFQSKIGKLCRGQREGTPQAVKQVAESGR